MKQPTIEMGFGFNDTELYEESYEQDGAVKEAIDRGSSKWTRVIVATVAPEQLVGVFKLQDDIDYDMMVDEDGSQHDLPPGELLFLPDAYKGRAEELSEERDKLPHRELLRCARQATAVISRMKTRAAEARQSEQPSSERPFALKPLEAAFVNFVNGRGSRARVAAREEAISSNNMGAGKRKKGNLTAAEVEHVLRLLKGKLLTNEDIAAEVGISTRSVSSVKSRTNRDPDYLTKLADEHYEAERVKACSLQIIGEKKNAGAPIWSVAQLMEEVRAKYATETSARHLRKLLKTEAGMTYRKLKRLSLQTNSERCLVLRSLAAARMLDLLHQDYRVINVDESWLNTSDCRHSKWGPRGKPNTLSMPFLGSKVNMIAGLDNRG